MRRAVLGLSACTLALLSGCRRQAASSTQPATAPAAAAVAHAQPVSQPTSSVMQINGRLFAFPPARLRLEQRDGRLTALLYSDDPKEAIQDDYDGNSFYLQMELDVEDAKDLSTAVWKFKAPSQEWADSPYGILLHGRKIQFEPYDVRGGFTTSPLTVNIAGQFLMSNDAEKGLPPVALVRCALPARVDEEEATTAPARP